jgi:hypothetical protein
MMARQIAAPSVSCLEQLIGTLGGADRRILAVLVNQELGGPVGVEAGDQVRALVPISPSRTPWRQIRVISAASRVASASGWLAAFRRLLSTISRASALVSRALRTRALSKSD